MKHVGGGEIDKIKTVDKCYIRCELNQVCQPVERVMSSDYYQSGAVRDVPCSCVHSLLGSFVPQVTEWWRGS